MCNVRVVSIYSKLICEPIKTIKNFAQIYRVFWEEPAILNGLNRNMGHLGTTIRFELLCLSVGVFIKLFFIKKLLLNKIKFQK